MKDIVLLVLRNGDHLLAQYDVIDADRLMLYNSYLVSGASRITLTVFPRYNATNRHIITRDVLYTIIDDIDTKLMVRYLEKVGDALVSSDVVERVGGSFGDVPPTEWELPGGRPLVDHVSNVKLDEDYDGFDYVELDDGVDDHDYYEVD